MGSPVDNDGQVIPIRMRPDVANEMTRNMLKTARVASACQASFRRHFSNGLFMAAPRSLGMEISSRTIQGSDATMK